LNYLTQLLLIVFFSKLDLETTEALIQGILSFHGGVLLVSHDQYLITSVCEDLVAIRNGKVDVLTKTMTSSEAFHAYKKATLLESGL
jgi:ATPase subunit of ABC transporter with duplicated ATPase domains